MESSGKRLARYLDSPGDAKRAKSGDSLLLQKVRITDQQLQKSTFEEVPLIRCHT